MFLVHKLFTSMYYLITKVGKRWLNILLFFFWQFVTPDTEVGTKGYETQRRILLYKARPFISGPMKKWNFSGKSRSVAATLNLLMENVATNGFCTVHTVDRITVFFKKSPADVDEDEFKRYEVTKDEYLRVFNERSDRRIISKDFFNKFLTSTYRRLDSEGAQYWTRRWSIAKWKWTVENWKTELYTKLQ